MTITVRKYTPADLGAAAEIWNEVVRDGVAFPQTEPLTEMTGGFRLDDGTYADICPYYKTLR